MIKDWRKPTGCIVTIERFMELELPISRTGASNQLIDTVNVEVINADNLGIWIEVGRLQNGYHTGVTYAVPTGGGSGGVWRGRCGIPDKLAALRAALRIVPKATGLRAMTARWSASRPRSEIWINTRLNN